MIPEALLLITGEKLLLDYTARQRSRMSTNPNATAATPKILAATPHARTQPPGTSAVRTSNDGGRATRGKVSTTNFQAMVDPADVGSVSDTNTVKFIDPKTGQEVPARERGISGGYRMMLSNHLGTPSAIINDPQSAAWHPTLEAKDRRCSPIPDVAPSIADAGRVKFIRMYTLWGDANLAL
jgi:hypothetical protein